MYFLTRFQLDFTKRSTMKALVSPNLFHGAVESAFPGERKRCLWRIDSLSGRNYLLLLSTEKPNLMHAVKQFGVEDNEPLWETKEYTPLLDRIQNGTKWRFRLTANPTKSCKNSSEKEKRGTVYAHITPEYQKQWLLERSEKHGFTLEENSFSVVEHKWQKFFKGSERRHPVTLLSVTYEGYLTVKDAELFKNTLVNGLGRGKAYGMGMLTVVKAR